VTISDDLGHDPEYEELFLRLVASVAEEVRCEGEDLAGHGFTVEQVIGSPNLLYRRGGKLYTREYALAVAQAIPDPREDW